MSEIRKWLEAIGLAQYADAFEANKIDLRTARLRREADGFQAPTCARWTAGLLLATDRARLSLR